MEKGETMRRGLRVIAKIQADAQACGVARPADFFPGMETPLGGGTCQDGRSNRNDCNPFGDETPSAVISVNHPVVSTFSACT
jgi:hypothetical protein